MKLLTLCSRWLAAAALLLAGCAGPVPRYAEHPELNRQLESASRHYQQGRLHEARAGFASAVTTAELLDQNLPLVQAWMAKGASERLLELDDDAQASYTQAWREARSADLPLLAWQAELALADLERRRGAVAQALTRLAQLRQQGAPGNAQRFSLDQGLALCLLAQQQPGSALALLQPWTQRAPELAPAQQAALSANLARAQLALGRTGQALDLAQHALQLDRQTPQPAVIAADHLLLAEVLQQAGRPTEAAAHAARAGRIRAALGLPATRAAAAQAQPAASN